MYDGRRELESRGEKFDTHFDDFRQHPQTETAVPSRR